MYERLKLRIAELEKSLEPFAMAADEVMKLNAIIRAKDPSDAAPKYKSFNITARHLRHARRILRKKC
jgi:cell division septum initiation protein DivIVA